MDLVFCHEEMAWSSPTRCGKAGKLALTRRKWPLYWVSAAAA